MLSELKRLPPNMTEVQTEYFDIQILAAIETSSDLWQERNLVHYFLSFHMEAICLHCYDVIGVVMLKENHVADSRGTTILALFQLAPL
jgi:hypothetical protein